MELNQGCVEFRFLRAVKWAIIYICLELREKPESLDIHLDDMLIFRAAKKLP